MRRFLLLMLVLVSGCGDDSPTGPSSNNGPLRGQVRDFVTQAGIAGASLRFSERSKRDEVSGTTDASGGYSLTTPDAGYYYVYLNDKFIGEVRVTSRYRGDLYANSGTCVARYGVVSDANTGAPVAGAVVDLYGQTSTSAADGWYRLDYGCPDSGTVGFNSTILTVKHPNYVTLEGSGGRGVSGVSRSDLVLTHR